jgi:hypothetical protein
MWCIDTDNGVPVDAVYPNQTFQIVSIQANHSKLGKLTNFDVIFLVMGFIFKLDYFYKFIPSPLLSFVV